MKITFWGSSHGIPEANRKCSCTMVEVSGQYYFIDMGIPVIAELVTRGIPVDAVRGIFLTHMHGDHSNGLIDFADCISWYFKTAEPEIYLPIIEGAAIIKDWLALHGVNRDLNYEEIEPGIIFDDGVLAVTAISTRHMVKSYAFLLEAEGKSVLFTGDLGKPSVDFPMIAREREIDLAVCEGAHFPIAEYKPVLEECRIKKVCINHYSSRNISDIQQLDKDMGKIPIVIANDGMEITV